MSPAILDWTGQISPRIMDYQPAQRICHNQVFGLLRRWKVSKICICLVSLLLLKIESLDNAILELCWLSHLGIWAIIPCSPNKVTVPVCSKLKTSWKRFRSQIKSGRLLDILWAFFTNQLFHRWRIQSTVSQVKTLNVLAILSVTDSTAFCIIFNDVMLFHFDTRELLC